MSPKPHCTSLNTASPCEKLHGIRKPILICLIAAIALLSCFSSDAEARGRKSSSGSRKAAAAARKKRMIQATEREIATAREVLAMAESHAGMSRAQVDQAINKLSGIRDAITSAAEDAKEAGQTKREIEAEIIAEQVVDSEFGRARSELNDAKMEVHQIMHRVLRLADHDVNASDASRYRDLTSMPPADRELLEQSYDYRTAYNKMKAAGRSLEQVRQKLFLADSEWVAAQREWGEAKARNNEAVQQAQTAGISSLRDRQDLRQAQNVSTAARAIIAQGEARLRQLGAKPKIPSNPR